MNTKLFESMVRHGIGLDPWFFERNADAPNFPPHNIVQLAEDRYRVTLAVAGFEPEELKIVIESDILTVSGHKEDEPEKDGQQVLYRGIAFRDFNRQFKIGDNVRVQDATLRHGLLNIVLVRELPEAQKPKVIEITHYE
jgi:molecular chaperone IbpA